MKGSDCYASLPQQAHLWIDFFHAAGVRDVKSLAQTAQAIHAGTELSAKGRELVVGALMTGYLDADQPHEVLALWELESEHFPGEMPIDMRLLISHAQLGMANSGYNVAESSSDHQ